VQKPSTREPESRFRPGARLLAVGLLVLGLACASSPDGEPDPEAEFAKDDIETTVPYFDRRDADVYLVPVGAFSQTYLVDLANYYEDDFGVRMGIAPALPYRDGLYNPARKQLVSEPVLAWMMTKLEEYSTNPDSVFIGVTHNDLYIATSSQRFAYLQRIPPNFAVVSSYRTTREPIPPSGETTKVQPGFRKLVTQTIGALHFDAPPSTDPRNVMYGPLRRLDDLEAIDESTAHGSLVE